MAKQKRYKRSLNGTELSNSGKAWGKKEKKFIMESDLADKDIAAILGRTTAAIHVARQKIYKSEDD